MHKSILLICLISLPSWATDLQFGSSWQQNINHSQQSSAIGDLQFDVAIGTNNTWFVGEQHRFDIRYQLSGNFYVDYSDLSDIELNIGGMYGWQPNLGFSSPWYQFAINSYLRWQPDEARQALSGDMQASISKRISDRIFASSSISYLYGHANNWVFDENQGSWSIFMDYQLNPKLSLYSSYDLSFGYMWNSVYDPDATAITTRAHHIPSEGISSKYGDIYLDDMVFGENWHSYRNNGWQQGATLGVNFGVSKMISLDMAYQYHYLFNDSDLSYSNHSVYFTVLTRFD